MSKLASIKNAIFSKSNADIEKSDVRLYNYVSSNFMIGGMCNILLVLVTLSALLNQLGVFNSNRTSMWIIVVLSFVLVIPIQFVLRKHKGQLKNMHWYLECVIIAICACLAMLLGHNVTLVMVIPVVISIRYYDYKFTAKIAIITVLLAIVLTFATAVLGVFNMNLANTIVKDTTLVVGSSLRKVLEEYVRGGGDLITSIQNGNSSFDAFSRPLFIQYCTSLLAKETLPRLLIYVLIAVSTCLIAKRGDEMLVLQQQAGQKQARIEGELSIATDIQSSMLPCIFPAFPEHKHLELFATYVPAKEVGGDFYDYFEIDEDRIAVVMADVSGKGVGAALFMTIAKIVLKNQLLLGIDIKDAVTEANRQLCENNEAGLFVTGWVGVYQISTCEMTFVNAGHNPPVIKRKKSKPEFINERHGIVMAAYEGSKYRQSVITLNSGDEIFLYTDGVTEANNSDGDLYGEDRLLEIVEKAYPKDSRQQIDFINEDINNFIGDAEQFDDITMMALKVK